MGQPNGAGNDFWKSETAIAVRAFKYAFGFGHKIREWVTGEDKGMDVDGDGD